jgi:hypothetical protein
MQLQIASTTEPTEPITDFNSWQLYLLSLQGEEGEFRRFKRDMEVSFDRLANSMNNHNFIEPLKQ